MTIYARVSGSTGEACPHEVPEARRADDGGQEAGHGTKGCRDLCPGSTGKSVPVDPVKAAVDGDVATEGSADEPATPPASDEHEATVEEGSVVIHALVEDGKEECTPERKAKVSEGLEKCHKVTDCLKEAIKPEKTVLLAVQEVWVIEPLAEVKNKDVKQRSTEKFTDEGVEVEKVVMDVPGEVQEERADYVKKETTDKSDPIEQPDETRGDKDTKKKDEKGEQGKQDEEKTEATAERYSPPLFVSQFFGDGEIPKMSLPYGFVRGDNKPVSMDLTVEGPFTHSLMRWYKEVFDECVEYIRDSAGSQDRYQWYHDFIAFTNLQIAVYNSPFLLNEQESMKVVMQYTAKHVRNLRSAIARTALLFVKRFISAASVNSTVFLASSLELLPPLFMCSTSEKKVYRVAAIENIKEIAAVCTGMELAWVFMDHCAHRHLGMCNTAAEALGIFLKRVSKEELSDMELPLLAVHVEPCLRSRSTMVKKTVTKFVEEVLTVLPQEHIDHFWSELGTSSRLGALIKPYVTVKELSEDAEENAESRAVTEPSAVTEPIEEAKEIHSRQEAHESD